MSIFEHWTCVFPGKLGLSWKQTAPHAASRAEAEAAAARNCNTVAVPVPLFEKIKEHERRMVRAERALPAVLCAAKDALWALDRLDRGEADPLTGQALDVREIARRLLLRTEEAVGDGERAAAALDAEVSAAAETPAPGDGPLRPVRTMERLRRERNNLAHALLWALRLKLGPEAALPAVLEVLRVGGEVSPLQVRDLNLALITHDREAERS